MKTISKVLSNLLKTFHLFYCKRHYGQLENAHGCELQGPETLAPRNSSSIETLRKKILLNNYESHSPGAAKAALAQGYTQSPGKAPNSALSAPKHGLFRTRKHRGGRNNSCECQDRSYQCGLNGQIKFFPVLPVR